MLSEARPWESDLGGHRRPVLAVDAGQWAAGPGIKDAPRNEQRISDLLTCQGRAAHLHRTEGQMACTGLEEGGPGPFVLMGSGAGRALSLG